MDIFAITSSIPPPSFAEPVLWSAPSRRDRTLTDRDAPGYPDNPQCETILPGAQLAHPARAR